jgi:hypothetical protein
MQRDGFEIIVDKSYEDLNPRDMFDDTCCDIEEIIRDIDRATWNGSCCVYVLWLMVTSWAVPTLGACSTKIPQNA